MPEPATAGEPRRSFLTRLGATLAAGVGLAAMGDRAAGARPRAARHANACAIYCASSACPGGCGPGMNLFHCYDQCAGGYYSCLEHDCSSFCLSANAC